MFSMKYYFTILGLSLCLACAQRKSVQVKPTDATTTAIIDSLLNDWHVAAAEGNYEAYFGKMDSQSIFIGTDATENWSKQEFETFSKPYFDKGRAWIFKPFDRNIYIAEAGNIVWFDELLDTWMGTCIGSGVFEQIEGSWKMKHYVLSVKVPNESIKAVVKAKHTQDSLFLSQHPSQKQ